VETIQASFFLFSGSRVLEKSLFSSFFQFFPDAKKGSQKRLKNRDQKSHVLDSFQKSLEWFF
jgi:hypothetical protein